MERLTMKAELTAKEYFQKPHVCYPQSVNELTHLMEAYATLKVNEAISQRREEIVKELEERKVKAENEYSNLPSHSIQQRSSTATEVTTFMQ
jgi:hypothetical protein